MIGIAIFTQGRTGAAVSGNSSFRSLTEYDAAATAGQRDSVRLCPSGRRGLAFYRSRYNNHLEARGASTQWPVGRKPRNCADASYLAELWQRRSFAARKATERYLATFLRDTPYADGNNAWFKAIDQAQRVFPGTKDWLISCSRPEGGHGRWVGYSGVSFSTWLRDSNTVGGNMQFRFGTFTGMYRNAYAYLRSKGFRVPDHLDDVNSVIGLTTAWRSALGQALAAGWARYTGNDNSHWSASWGRGC